MSVEPQHETPVIGSSTFSVGKYPKLDVGERAASEGSSQRIHSSKVPNEKLSWFWSSCLVLLVFVEGEKSSTEEGRVYVADGKERSVGDIGEVLFEESL